MRFACSNCICYLLRLFLLFLKYEPCGNAANFFSMDVKLTQNEALKIFSNLRKYCAGENKLPAGHFSLIIDYLEFFECMIKEIPFEKRTNIIPLVNRILNNAQDIFIRQLILVSLQLNVPLDYILRELISEKALIVRRYWRSFYRQIKNKKDKAYVKSIWEHYNHWVLAIAYWQGFLQSFNDELCISITFIPGAWPFVMVIDAVNKPLWCMWSAGNLLGQVFTTASAENNGIENDPIYSWTSYMRDIDVLSKLTHIPIYQLLQQNPGSN